MGISVGYSPCGQNRQIRFPRNGPSPIPIFTVNDQPVGPATGCDFRGLALDKHDPLLASPAKKLLISLVRRPDIYVKDGDLGIRVFVPDVKGRFYAGHAAIPRTVSAVPLIPGTCALNKGDPTGDRKIGWPD